MLEQSNIDISTWYNAIFLFECGPFHFPLSIMGGTLFEYLLDVRFKKHDNDIAQ